MGGMAIDPAATGSAHKRAHCNHASIVILRTVRRTCTADEIYFIFCSTRVFSCLYSAQYSKIITITDQKVPVDETPNQLTYRKATWATLELDD